MECTINNGMNYLQNLERIDRNSEKSVSADKDFIYTPENNNGLNMYSAKEYLKNKINLMLKAKQRTDLSKQSKKTGIIPQNYNKLNEYKKKVKINENYDDSVFSDDISEMGSNCSNNSCSVTDPLFMMKQAEKFNKKNTTIRKEIKKENKNGFLSQFDELRYDNPSDPVSMNNVNEKTGNQNARYQLERQMALDGGYSPFQNSDMTYGITNMENFTHNNMVPFYGKGKGYGYDPVREQQIENYNKTKIDNFTGTLDNPAWKRKQEQGAMFSPILGLTNPYGQPVMTQFYESRYIPGKERRNELPFQQQRITPGLNLGYNEIGRQGYRDTYRVMPKTVDELRPANKPKVSYKGVIINGMKGSRGPVLGEIKKRKPVTFKEYSVKDLIPGVGDYRAQRITGHIDPNLMASVNRGTNDKMIIGTTKFFKDLPILESMKAKVRTAVKQNYLHAEPRSVNLAHIAEKGRPNDAATTQAKMTQRAVLNKNEYFGPLGNKEIEKGYAFSTKDNIPDDTMRSIYGNVDRAGVVGNAQIGQSYLHNTQNAIPDANMRNIHQDAERYGHVGNAQLNQAYAYNNKNAVPDANMRNIHQDVDRYGQIGNAQLNQAYAYNNKNAIPDANMRNIHQDVDRYGHVGNAQLNQPYIYDVKNAIPDANMRDVHQDVDRYGHVGNAQLNQPYIYDVKNAIPDANMRDVHQDTDRYGHIGNTQLNQPYIYDVKNNILDPTMRDVHQDTDRYGHIGNTQLNQPYVYDVKNNILDPTMRDVHQDTDRYGHIGNTQLNQAYAFNNKNAIPDQNMRNVHQDVDRYGHVGNNQLNQGYMYNNQNATPDPTMRDVYNKMDRAGVVGNTNVVGKSYAFNTNNAIQDPTMRDIYNKMDRAGVVGNTNVVGKSYAFNTNNAIQDPTMRDIYNKMDRAGVVGNTNVVGKSYAFNTKDNIPDQTQREIYIKTDRAGVVGNSQLNQGYVQDIKNAIPDQTMREIHVNNKYIGTAKYVVDQLRARDDVKNAQTNATKEIISKGRTPTLSNYSRGPTMDYTTVQLCDPILIENREQYPDSSQLTTHKLPFLMKLYNPLPLQNKYINEHIDESLQGNPFINNMVHLSDNDTKVNIKIDKLMNTKIVRNNDPDRPWN